MTRRETPFVADGDLIIIEGFVTGPLGTKVGRFVLDTGSVLTTLIPELADSIGYSARDAIRRARVRTAVGSEEGYILRVAEFDVFGFAMASFPVHVFDLGLSLSVSRDRDAWTIAAKFARLLFASVSRRSSTPIRVVTSSSRPRPISSSSSFPNADRTRRLKLMKAAS